METRDDLKHELYDKYKELENCKVFAIKKAFKNFYSVPLEVQDLEYIAWKAFLETEEKYNIKKRRKSYHNFYLDCLYWKAKDYCVKYSSNHHKTINLAEQLSPYLSYKSYQEETREEKLLDRLAVQAYVEMNKHNDKGLVAKLFMYDFSPKLICKEIACSKSKLYRIIAEVRTDINSLLGSPRSREK